MRFVTCSSWVGMLLLAACSNAGGGSDEGLANGEGGAQGAESSPSPDLELDDEASLTKPGDSSTPSGATPTPPETAPSPEGSAGGPPEAPAPPEQEAEEPEQTPDPDPTEEPPVETEPKEPEGTPGVEDPDSPDTPVTPGPEESEEDPSVVEPTAKSLAAQTKLVPLTTCEAVDEAARAAALRAMNDLVDEKLEEAQTLLAEGQCQIYQYYLYEDGFMYAGGMGTGGAAAYAPSANTADAAPSDPSATPEEVSETNNQVAGVDEADYIKNDDDGMIYLLDDGDLLIIDGWPPEQSQIIARVPLDNEPKRLFVEGDRLVVYSSVPKAAEETVGYQDWYYASSQGECTYGYDCDFTGDGLGTQLEIYDITDRTAPVLVRTIDTSATFISARRVGDAIHTVLYQEPEFLRTLPLVPADIETNGFCTGTVVSGTEPDTYTTVAPAEGDAERLTEAFDVLRAQNLAAIEEAPIEELIGVIEDRLASGDTVGGEREICSGFYDSPLADGTAFLTLMSFDLAAEEPAQTSTIVSRPGASYASGASYYVSVRQQPLYGYWYSGLEEVEEASTVHKFSLDGPSNQYAASGLVKGRVLNQFSMDEYSDHLRIATTTGHLPSPDVHSTLSVLRQSEDALEVVGQVDEIAPAEDIRSVRFLGERGYVVTFKKTDPLFVFDLSDPENPAAVGELKIPGFSTYLHPLDDGHLLSIGYDSDDQETFAWFTGLLLQIFDVSNPEDPLLLHREVIGARGSSSEAATNHLAFTYFPPRKMLAIPATVCTESAGGGSYAETMTFSGLLLYNVDVTEGFSVAGSVDHPYVDPVDSGTYYVGGECSNWWTDSNSVVQRSLFMDDYVYSVSDLRVKVNDIRDLSEDVADIELQAPVTE